MGEGTACGRVPFGTQPQSTDSRGEPTTVGRMSITVLRRKGDV